MQAQVETDLGLQYLVSRNTGLDLDPNHLTHWYCVPDKNFRKSKFSKKSADHNKSMNNWSKQQTMQAQEVVGLGLLILVWVFAIFVQNLRIFTYGRSNNTGR